MQQGQHLLQSVQIRHKGRCLQSTAQEKQQKKHKPPEKNSLLADSVFHPLLYHRFRIPSVLY